MNKYESHVMVIPEDDANRQLADGFVNHHRVDDRRIQVMPPAGGWSDVLDIFQEEYIPWARKYPKAYVVMLIDFDGCFDTRRIKFEDQIPDDIKPRVFVVGSLHTPEILRAELNKSFEDIGNFLATECESGISALWEHALLKHNDPDRQRLLQTVKPFLF